MSRKMTDKELRELLAQELSRKESIETRMDVAKANWSEGLPIYIGSSEFPGLLEEVHPDGRRVLGAMVNRKFIKLTPTKRNTVRPTKEKP